MTRFILTAALCCGAAFPVGAGATVDSTTVLAEAHRLSDHVSRGEAAPLWAVFDESMRAAMQDSVRFDAMMTGIHAEVGALGEVLAERVYRDRGLWVYEARCRSEKTQDAVVLVIAFNPGGGVAGLALRPEEKREYPSTRLDYATKTPLRLPFRGEWYVFWGGRTIEGNHHAASKSQRFAHDFAIVKDGTTHTGDGSRLTDYYCYGAEILAPADGLVVWACDSLPDQQPGQMDPAHPVGNGIVIDHGNGEFSLLAHMQPNSARVRAGDRVTTGSVVGLCGNSGNTTEPHLHYHLQDGPDMRAAEGLPARFISVVVDGGAMPAAEFVRGQMVRNDE